MLIANWEVFACCCESRKNKYEIEKCYKNLYLKGEDI